MARPSVAQPGSAGPSERLTQFHRGIPMANSAERARYAARWAVGPRPGAPVLEPVPGLTASDWSLIVSYGMNALIEGDEDLTQALIRALTPCLRPPIRSWRQGPLTDSSAT